MCYCLSLFVVLLYLYLLVVLFVCSVCVVWGLTVLFVYCFDVINLSCS